LVGSVASYEKKVEIISFLNTLWQRFYQPSVKVHDQYEWLHLLTPGVAAPTFWLCHLARCCHIYWKEEGWGVGLYCRYHIGQVLMGLTFYGGWNAVSGATELLA
jgi:hypothetical protein